MKFLPILFLTLLPIPAQAITWKEFWEPFANAETHYHHRHYHHKHYYAVCTERVYYEEYVPGNYWRSGYVRRWYETVTVSCD